jgi:hypothetical protein
MADPRNTAEINERIDELERLIEEWKPEMEAQTSPDTRPGPEQLALTNVERWKKERDKLKAQP